MSYISCYKQILQILRLLSIGYMIASGIQITLVYSLEVEYTPSAQLSV